RRPAVLPCASLGSGGESSDALLDRRQRRLRSRRVGSPSMCDVGLTAPTSAEYSRGDLDQVVGREAACASAVVDGDDTRWLAVRRTDERDHCGPLIAQPSSHVEGQLAYVASGRTVGGAVSDVRDTGEVLGLRRELRRRGQEAF